MTDKSPPATLTMRAADAQRPVPKIERYAAGRWTALKTYAIGRDIYSAALPQLGTYAVIGSQPLDLTGGSAGNAGGGGTNVLGIGIAVAAAVVVVALIVVAVYRRRRRVAP